jgi:hypothetical protein
LEHGEALLTVRLSREASVSPTAIARSWRCGVGRCPDVIVLEKSRLLSRGFGDERPKPSTRGEELDRDLSSVVLVNDSFRWVCSDRGEAAIFRKASSENRLSKSDILLKLYSFRVQNINRTNVCTTQVTGQIRLCDYTVPVRVVVVVW